MIRKSVRNLIVVCLTLHAIGLFAKCALADVGLRCGDEVWLISARQDCGCCNEFPVQEYCNGVWCESSMDTLAASETAGISNVVFVHGYQTDLQDARDRGIQTYANLFKQCRNSGPIRYIIWAWKSERESARLVQDFTMKSRRAVALGYRFAESMNQLGSDQIVVVGYSLGAQVVIAGLTGPCQYYGAPIRMAVISPASDCGFAMSHSMAAGHIQETVVFANRKDRAIKASNLICRSQYGRCFRQFLDLAANNHGELGYLRLVDITSISTRKHSILRYSSLPVVQQTIQQLVCDAQRFSINLTPVVGP